MSITRISPIALLLALAACGSDLNPYGRSEYENAEKPINESTNTSVSDGFADAVAADSEWSDAVSDDGGWGEGTE